jgi:diguanylate cyclase (GGDEF)-like protein
MASVCKVLIVDDSADHQFLYETMLKKAVEGGFAVVSAANARAGLLACQVETPDCILLDLNLPDLGGLDFIEELRESFGELPCAVVIITAHGSESVAVEAMKRGVQDYLVKGQINSASLRDAITKAVDNVANQRRQEEEQARMFHMALHDSLTGLANRLHFESRLAHALDLARRTHSLVTLLTMDLDGFKALNDELGHHAGDEALVQVAERLRTVLRESDTLARLGGDEFALLMESHPSREGAIAVAGRVVEAFKAPMVLENRSIQVGISIGIAHSDVDVDAATLVRHADSAMYRAKRSRSVVAEFNSESVPQPPSMDTRRAAKGATALNDQAR